MKVRKKIIRVGAGHGIYIDKIFMKLLDLHEGDIIEIDSKLINTEFVKIIKQKGNGKQKNKS